MLNVNKVLCAGRLTRDAKVTTFQGDRKVAKLSVALNKRIKKNDEWVDKVCYVEVDAWGYLAEKAEKHGTKGAPIFLEGELEMFEYEKKDGSGKVSGLNIVASVLKFISPAKSTKTEEATASVGSDDDAPF